MSSRRHLAAVVLSDLHLGTFGCHARELLAYLKSIQPDVLILNGDIIDIWKMYKDQMACFWTVDEIDLS